MVHNLKFFLHVDVSQYEATRPVSGEYGLAAVPEHEPGLDDTQSSELQVRL